MARITFSALHFNGKNFPVMFYHEIQKGKFQNQIIHRSGPAQNFQYALIPKQIELGIVPCGTTTYLP